MTGQQPSVNRKQLNASVSRLQAALAKLERADQRRGIKTGRTNALYSHVIKTIDGLTDAIKGEA